MTAAELPSLSQRLTNHAIGYGDYAIAGQLREAAEVLELLAWTEENSVGVERADGWNVFRSGKWYVGDTLLDTLRRTREAARLVDSHACELLMAEANKIEKG